MATATLGLVLILAACGGGGGTDSKQACIDRWNKRVDAHNTLIDRWNATSDTAPEGETFETWARAHGASADVINTDNPPACVREAFNK